MTSSKTGASPRVMPGHAIQHQGMTLADDGSWTSNGVGKGFCKCGIESPTLPNSLRRRRWQRQHLDDIASGGTGEVGKDIGEPDEFIAYLRATWPEVAHLDPVGRGPAPRTIAERFFRFVDATVSCWEWTGARNEKGYGEFSRGRGKGRTMSHRVAWEHLVGAIPEGIELDHLCRNRGCVNPDHLEPVSHRENLRRGFGFGALNSLKSTCPNGHEYDTVRRNPSGGLQRSCSKCIKARLKEREGPIPEMHHLVGRNTEIFERWKAGEKQVDLAVTFGLTKNRVNQIVRDRKLQ